MSPVDDFFRSRLAQMIDLRHPLVILPSRMPWQEIDTSLVHQFARQVKVGKSVQDIGLFGTQTTEVGGVISNAGRPSLTIRLMVSLLYLKHVFNESDDTVVEHCADTPTWQYFSGMDYFEHRFPCDTTLIGKFRKLIGEDGVEELLSQTISVALNLKAISKKALKTVVADSTVQPKAIAHPTDSRLLAVARRKLVDIAISVGIKLKQTFAKEGKQLTRKAGGYAHARQFRRMRKPINRRRTIVGRLAGEIERQLATIAQDLKQSVLDALRKAQQLMTQTKHRKTKSVHPSSTAGMHPRLR